MEAIRSDERTRELTLGFRQHRFDSLKNESMLFAVPCVFEGGKAQNRVEGITDADYQRAQPYVEAVEGGEVDGFVIVDEAFVVVV